MDTRLQFVLFKIRLKAAFFVFFVLSLFGAEARAQVYWVGGTSTDYYTKANWSDPNIDFANLSSTTLIIGAGSPNNPVQSGGNSSNTNYRANFLNTKSNAVFTINGALYTWNSDSVNGTVTINSPADFNIRNIAYVGRNGTASLTVNGGKISSRNAFYIGTGNSGSSATVSMPGGAMYVGTDLYIANSSGTSAQLNITGGAVYIPRNLTIGTGGAIFISGIGLISVTGDKTTVINDYIAAGKITCSAGKTLSVVFDGTNTVVSIPQDPNSMLREYPTYVVLKNSLL